MLRRPSPTKLALSSEYHEAELRRRGKGCETIACIFDERDLRGTLQDAYDRVRAATPWGRHFGAMAFASDHVAVALQAADLRVYMIRAQLVVQMRGLVTIRPEYRMLRRAMHTVLLLNAASIADLVRQLEEHQDNP